MRWAGQAGRNNIVPVAYPARRIHAGFGLRRHDCGQTYPHALYPHPRIAAHGTRSSGGLETTRRVCCAQAHSTSVTVLRNAFSARPTDCWFGWSELDSAPVLARGRVTHPAHRQTLIFGWARNNKRGVSSARALYFRDGFCNADSRTHTLIPFLIDVSRQKKLLIMLFNRSSISGFCRILSSRSAKTKCNNVTYPCHDDSMERWVRPSYNVIHSRKVFRRFCKKYASDALEISYARSAIITPTCFVCVRTGRGHHKLYHISFCNKIAKKSFF